MISLLKSSKLGMGVRKVKKIAGNRLNKARTIKRNRRDLGTSLSQIPFLTDYNTSKIDPNGIIRSAYEEYTNSISSPVATISLELAYVLWFILTKQRPRQLIDLGSGFSSYLFRLYQRDCESAGGTCQVFSCDDDSLWLQRTSDFLTSKRLSVSGLLLWDKLLEEQRRVSPNLVLHDLGSSWVRLRTLPRVLELCNPNTILVVDDIHKPSIRQAVLDSVQSRARCYDLAKLTYDRFGRYAWLINDFSAGARNAQGVKNS